MCIQNIFLARNGGRKTADFPSLEATVRAEHPEWESALDSVRAFVANREYYKALRTLKPLLDANLFSSKREPGLELPATQRLTGSIVGLVRTAGKATSGAPASRSGTAYANPNRRSANLSELFEIESDVAASC